MTAPRPLARGDVILVSFPFTDLSARKLRPAVIVARISGEDLVLAFVTSRPAPTDPQADVLLEPGQADYAQAGLKVASIIRLGRLATLHRDLARRRIGFLGQRTIEAVERALRYVFEL